MEKDYQTSPKKETAFDEDIMFAFDHSEIESILIRLTTNYVAGKSVYKAGIPSALTEQDLERFGYRLSDYERKFPLLRINASSQPTYTRLDYRVQKISRTDDKFILDIHSVNFETKNIRTWRKDNLSRERNGDLQIVIDSSLTTAMVVHENVHHSSGMPGELRRYFLGRLGNAAKQAQTPEADYKNNLKVLSLAYPERYSENDFFDCFIDREKTPYIELTILNDCRPQKIKITISSIEVINEVYKGSILEGDCEELGDVRIFYSYNKDFPYITELQYTRSII